MGLNWSAPKLVKEKTLYIVSAPFPIEKTRSEELWEIWKNHKEVAKSDGFSPNKYQGAWSISYFHNVNSNTFELTDEGETLWTREFKNKCAKWQKIIEKIREAKASITEDLLSDDISMENFED